MANQLLYSVKEIFTSYCSAMKYSIPSYQRGYKWEEKDVKRLLDDIMDFKLIDGFDVFYCLQNVTLIKKDDVLNVVDGQQRLTTLSILLSYLGEADMVKGKLVYSIRRETQYFLDKYVYNDRLLDRYTDWDLFIEESGQEYDYQDIFYIFTAWKTIDEWFKKYHEEQRELMKNKILNNVKLIVNRPVNTDEHKLFENLNGKRVPLDGADLVRAMIITRSAKLKIAEKEGSIKYDVLLNEYRTNIGNRLDIINQWWQNADCQKFFSYFMDGTEAVGDGMVEFNQTKYPINNLYLLYVAIYNEGKLCLDFFEKQVTDTAFLDRLINFQRLLRNWYEDRILYHLIPFVLIYCEKDDLGQKVSFKGVFDNWYKFSRKGFIGYLKRCIANNTRIKELSDSPSDFKEIEKLCFNEDWYSDKDKPIVMVSVLLDIIKLLTSYNRSDYLPPEYFKQKDEDKEHIFPQTPIAGKVKDTVKQTFVLKQYVEIINTLIKKRAENVIVGEKLEIAPVVINDSNIDWDDEEWKDKIKDEINSKILKLMPINSLGNMCLLDKSVNRSYGNDFFQEKRIDIMTKAQESHYIRPHVYDAFNKVFLERTSGDCGIGRMSVWDKSDIIDRRQYIVGQIKKFLENDKEQCIFERGEFVDSPIVE